MKNIYKDMSLEELKKEYKKLCEYEIYGYPTPPELDGNWSKTCYPSPTVAEMKRAVERYITLKSNRKY